MTIEIAGSWLLYAGAFNVRTSAIEGFPVAGRLVEFGAYEPGVVWAYDLETGDHPATPLVNVEAEHDADGGWRLRTSSQLLMHLDEGPIVVRSFALPRGAATLRRWFRRHPLREPRIVSLPEIFDAELGRSHVTLPNAD